MVFSEGLSGKTYKGKETLLDAISAVCTAGAEFIAESMNTKEIILAVMAECKRTDKVNLFLT
jgi:hypothetical protein